MHRIMLVIILFSVALLGCDRQPGLHQVSSKHKPGQTGMERPIKKRRAPVLARMSKKTTSFSQVQSKLKWPRAIHKKVLSPNGKHLAVWDSKGIYIADATGKRITKMKINIVSIGENLDVSLAYNPQSTRLAILTKSSGGEPGICENDHLYWADVKSRKTWQIGRWEECIQGNGEAVVNRELMGWSTDGNSVQLQAEVWQGEGMPGADSIINKSMRNVSFDVRHPKTWKLNALASHLSW